MFILRIKKAIPSPHPVDFILLEGHQSWAQTAPLQSIGNTSHLRAHIFFSDRGKMYDYVFEYLTF